MNQDLTALADHLRRSRVLVADVDLALREDHRFLVLKVVHRDANEQLLSPSPIVDVIWHAHLIDTMSYMVMNDALPFIIHHDPRGTHDDDAANRAHWLDNTRACYRARWGDLLAAAWDDGASSAAVRERGARRASVAQVSTPTTANTQEVVKVTLLLPNKRDKVLFLVKETTSVAKVVTHFADRIHAHLSTLRF
ncbi:hypothetical protein AMAG_10656 [Allomyces macrogynus ATCC 38327]|uniref:Uncharacterized protein n=1 Tax=Allomyces macrogynus (strain ATCC 38327) TaxID=578462 RepID=A0A0L0SR41_ALLM3|nr:hypothetical protein AMAG_10656 [Allomyces macrogynus ATCC 38327]|eukprot:KNE64988.1 hypothetical protein AMAG_10656 [Allomyces macrogynus ATCC 38327]